MLHVFLFSSDSGSKPLGLVDPRFRWNHCKDLTISPSRCHLLLDKGSTFAYCLLVRDLSQKLPVLFQNRLRAKLSFPLKDAASAGERLPFARIWLIWPVKVSTLMGVFLMWNLVRSTQAPSKRKALLVSCVSALPVYSFGARIC